MILFNSNKDPKTPAAKVSNFLPYEEKENKEVRTLNVKTSVLVYLQNNKTKLPLFVRNALLSYSGF